MFDSTSFGINTGRPVELYKNDKAIDTATGHPGASLEANLWLPAASKVYKISPKLSDYVLVPVPVVLNDIPNTNGDCVSLSELLKFDPVVGMQAFKTFRGKPCFFNHVNQDITQAKGVILDAILRPVRNYGQGKYYKLVLLLSFDRTKDPLLVNQILTGEINTYSFGFNYSSYTCSICNKTVNQATLRFPCPHTKLKQPTYRQDDGRLAYRYCHYINGFECSAVNSPAFVFAISDIILNS